MYLIILQKKCKLWYFVFLSAATFYNYLGTLYKQLILKFKSTWDGSWRNKPTQSSYSWISFWNNNRISSSIVCYFGYCQNIRSMVKNKLFNCRRISFDKFISNINYSSISISKLDRHQVAQTLKRIVTDVGTPNATCIECKPQRLVVKVLQEKLIFKEASSRLSSRSPLMARWLQEDTTLGLWWIGGRHSHSVTSSIHSKCWIAITDKWHWRGKEIGSTILNHTICKSKDNDYWCYFILFISKRKLNKDFSEPLTPYISIHTVLSYSQVQGSRQVAVIMPKYKWLIFIHGLFKQ